MLLFGINFNLFFFVVVGKFKDALKSEELRTYLAIVTLASAVIAFNTFRSFEGLGDCIRTAFFQVTSIISTTGFATVESNSWPVLAKTMLVLLMMCGACAGSTTGGLKISRILILFKNIFREIKHMIRPKSVNVVRIDGEVVPDETIRSATSYLSFYLAFTIVCTALIALDGYSLETNVTAALSCVNNVGPAWGDIGTMGNFSGFSNLSTFVLTLTMLFGRLEFVPMIVFFSPFAWKKR